MTDRLGGIKSCDDACGCPSPCPGGLACRCTSSDVTASGEEHRTCSCSELNDLKSRPEETKTDEEAAGKKLMTILIQPENQNNDCIWKELESHLCGTEGKPEGSKKKRMAKVTAKNATVIEGNVMEDGDVMVEIVEDSKRKRMAEVTAKNATVIEGNVMEDGDVMVEIVEDTEPLRKKLDQSRSREMILKKPTERMAQQLNPLYINAHFNGTLVNRVLVDNGSAVNILPVSMLAKLAKSENDLIPTNVTVKNFQGERIEGKGSLLVEITVGGKSIMTKFFVVESKSNYNALLGRHWIHASLCVPSSLHQALWFWNGREVKVVQADN